MFVHPCLCDQVVRQSDSDQVTVIGAGVTLHEALTAADKLAAQGNPHCPLVIYAGIVMRTCRPKPGNKSSAGQYIFYKSVK